MQANYVQRIRLTFSKIGPTRFIGHLDLARTLERALNRAGIPVAYTQGFNRRPRMSMATALPLGYTSECELADIWLTETLAPDVVGRQMMHKMAPGIIVSKVVEVPLNRPALQTVTAASTYAVSFLDPVDASDLEKRVHSILVAQELMRERKQGRKGKIKRYDLRPLIYDLQVVADANGRAGLQMELALMPSKTGRPDEVLTVMGFDPLAARIHRTHMSLAETEAHKVG